MIKHSLNEEISHGGIVGLCPSGEKGLKGNIIREPKASLPMRLTPASTAKYRRTPAELSIAKVYLKIKK